jgi:hypothetical protein
VVSYNRKEDAQFYFRIYAQNYFIINKQPGEMHSVVLTGSRGFHETQTQKYGYPFFCVHSSMKRRTSSIIRVPLRAQAALNFA